MKEYTETTSQNCTAVYIQFKKVLKNLMRYNEYEYIEYMNECLHEQK